MTDASAKGQAGVGLAVGFFGGLLATCLLGAVPAYLVSQRLAQKGRAGWNLMPVVVAATDVGLGTGLTFDLLSQRSVPESAVSKTVVTPDDASMVMSAVPRVRLEASDLLLWSYLDPLAADPPCLELGRKALAPWAATPGGRRLTRLLEGRE